MERPVGVLFAAVALSICLAGPAPAQTSSNQPTSNGVAQQFKSGADRVGHGAVQIGEGIKQGAIMTWQAIRDGANSFAARFDGNQSFSNHDRAGSTQRSR